MGNKRAMEIDSPHMASSDKKSCPFIDNSFSECYCNSMSSLQAEDALYYCGRNYLKCPVYKEKRLIDGDLQGL
ncbi:MAG: hypothetical protein RQ824_03150 [bacterium]|nr:hypothetical protein [bacterium]